MPQPTKSESRIQQELVTWYRNTYCLAHHNPRCMIFSIPNEGRGAASAALINTGLYPGCADLQVLHVKEQWRNNYDGEKVLVGYRTIVLFIECKREDGVQSDKQKEFEKHSRQVGSDYHIVRSLDEFRGVIEKL